MAVAPTAAGRRERMRREDDGAEDLWVFGYGSLMWRPGFATIERQRATLTGWHRAFCISSTHHRGTMLRPGLVLGLDRGGVCEGVAYRVAGAVSREVLGYLRARELVNGVYREIRTPVRLADGRVVRALAYIVERAHPSYAGAAPLAIQARMIRGARGLSGDNLDYLVNTVGHLRAAGIRERRLDRLMGVAGALVAQLAVAHPERLVSPTATALRRTVGRVPLRGAKVRTLPKGERRRFLYRMRLTRTS
jgi:glutathione-specific gamma-glutamylcyclotransferase